MLTGIVSIKLVNSTSNETKEKHLSTRERYLRNEGRDIVKSEIIEQGQLMNYNQGDLTAGYPANMSYEDIVKKRQREAKKAYRAGTDHYQTILFTNKYLNMGIYGQINMGIKLWREHLRKIDSNQQYALCDREVFLDKEGNLGGDDQHRKELFELFQTINSMKGLVAELDEGLRRYQELEIQAAQQQQRQRQ